MKSENYTTEYAEFKLVPAPTIGNGETLCFDQNSYKVVDESGKIRLTGKLEKVRDMPYLANLSTVSISANLGREPVYELGHKAPYHCYTSPPEATKGTLYFCVGIARSGKSTACREWLNTVGPRPRVIVSGDSVRQALHGGVFSPNAEGHVFATIDTMARALLLSGFDVIIDETSTTEATILRYLKIDPEAVPVWINTPTDVCIQRALVGNKPYLVEPIKRMASQLEKLKAEYPHNFLRMKEYVAMRQKQDVSV